MFPTNHSGLGGWSAGVNFLRAHGVIWMQEAWVPGTRCELVPCILAPTFPRPGRPSGFRGGDTLGSHVLCLVTSNRREGRLSV